MGEVIVRTIDMPTDIKGMTILDEDGNYNIYINDRLSYDMRLQVYEHELTHVGRSDHYRDIDIQLKENIERVPGHMASVSPLVTPQETLNHDKEREDLQRIRRIERNYRRMRKSLQNEIQEQLDAMSPMQRYRFLNGI